MNKYFTIPNIITSLRILLIPLFLYFLVQDNPSSRLLALLIFFIASISDFFDGYLARRLGQDSRIGRFLDPLADKILVITTIFAFYYLDSQIPLWMVLVIIGRDILITLMRYLAIKKGMELKTSKTAKAKTAFQMFSIVLILAIFFVRSYRFDIQQTFNEGLAAGKKNIEIAAQLFREGLTLLPHKDIDKHRKRVVFAESVPYFLMLVTTLFTIFSGLRYIYFNYRIFLPPYYLFAKRKELAPAEDDDNTKGDLPK